MKKLKTSIEFPVCILQILKHYVPIRSSLSKNISNGTKNQELDILNQLCNASIVSENDFDHAKKK